MALPCGTTGSLCSSFLPVRLVSQSSAFMPLHSTTVTNRPEGTLGSLRYTFGGDHPSQTTHQTVSSPKGIRIQITKGRISRWLHKHWRTCFIASGLSYTLITQIQCKAAVKVHGVFSVPLRVIGIFTDTTISPSSRLRQCPDRYTIRAGRNLPDKGIFATLGPL